MTTQPEQIIEDNLVRQLAGMAYEAVTVPLLANLKTQIEAHNGVAIGFTAYLMQSRSIMRVAQGTKILGLSYKRLGEIKMRLPHFDEQKKIADCLSALDRKIEAVEAQVLRTREFKQGLLQKMFV